MPEINIYNIDCLEYMKTLKDKAFDLAIVDKTLLFVYTMYIRKDGVYGY